MAAPLKDFFDEEVVRSISGELRRAHPSLPEQAFIASCMNGLSGLELAARASHIADAMFEHLPRPFAAAAGILVSSLGPEIPPTGNNGLSPLRYWPHTLFVQKHGLDDFETAMHAQYELTKRFSAEGSIRAFIVKYPEETYARLTKWAGDPNAHVRRLVSEGTRPRLPWAPRLREFQRDPRPVLALLERLKDDPVRYVQRSVANNLNDIAKDHPDLVADLCRTWLRGAPPGRIWIVKHALRSLVKAGHRGALAALGADSRPSVTIDGIRLDPASVELGGKLRFSFVLASESDEDQNLLIDYAVHFVKANSATRRKVFKLRKLVLAPSDRIALNGAVSFAEMTTRRHYPGDHRIELLVNGVPHPLGAFEVRR